jgi:hypothetical protein
LALTISTRLKQHTTPHHDHVQQTHFFGCPVGWVKKVTPLVHSKGELLAAIHLWRLRVIQHNRKTVVLGNSWLSDELGIDRFVKSRMLHRLKRAGLVRVQSKPGQAPRVTFLKAK